MYFGEIFRLVGVPTTGETASIIHFFFFFGLFICLLPEGARMPSRTRRPSAPIGRLIKGMAELPRFGMDRFWAPTPLKELFFKQT